MTKENYKNYLVQKGYTIIRDDLVSLGSLIFEIKETDNHTAMGPQKGFCLKLSPSSDLNLCPNPWH